MTIEYQWEVAESATPDPVAPGLAATMATRILFFLRSDPTFRAIVAAYSTRAEDFIAACDAVRAAFDLDNAVGVQLDRLGQILQRPRHGLADERYRTILQIQVELILASTSTTPSILRIVELYTGEAPLSFARYRPTGYIVGAVVDPADVPLLAQLLGEATAATYGVTLIASDEDSMILNYTETDPVADPGILNYTEADPVADPASLSYEHVLE